MKFCNVFGIKPTNTYASAGSDYYLPNLVDLDEKTLNKVISAFKKSYKIDGEDWDHLVKCFTFVMDEKHIPESQLYNLLHLYLALYDVELEHAKKSMLGSVYLFIEKFVIYDKEKNLVGIQVQLNDTLFINSGIKIALDTVLSKHVAPKTSDLVKLLRMLGIGVAGLYVNKSGMGNRGWDIRACLVDEDYSGYVHLSLSYTKDDMKNNKVYCGDKLTQMILIPVFHDEYENIDEDTYDKLMSNSLRGADGFGSSDIKH